MLTTGEIIIIVISSLILCLLIFIIVRPKKEENLKEDLSQLRMELTNTLTNMQNIINQNIASLMEQSSSKEMEKINLLISTLNNNLDQIKKSLEINTKTMEDKLEAINRCMNSSITNLQNENSKKLDEMRNVVDEKLQKTLNERLSQSFQMVQNNLQEVAKGIGEMQTLAKGVGDLKKVLSNVKTRGILGETQLGSILEQVLAPEQYVINVKTKKGSNDPVEFAIKLPGEGNDTVLLPIDAKFPMDTYQTLLQAYDTGDVDTVKSALNNLITTIKKFGKDIHDKYIDVPNTTEFGIMFLPVEGLYAEVVKSGVTEALQRDYKINVSGPSTMAAFLNSLQMGFKTLAIQKRSSEVWKVLGAVKTEFNNFETVLKKAQDKLNQANDEIENLVGTRTRKIKKRLEDVTSLPGDESKKLIDNNSEE